MAIFILVYYLSFDDNRPSNLLQIILSQEKNIQKLNEIVQSLREELLHCRGGSEVDNTTATHLTELLTELERHPILED